MSQTLEKTKNPWILIIGAGSDIALAVARKFAARGNNLYLAAHNLKDLESFAKDLFVRYRAEAKILPFDVVDTESHHGFMQRLPVKPRGVLLVAGYFGDQKLAERDPAEARKILEVNFLGCVSILEICAEYFEEHGGDFIAAISSVAGDRGRRINYFYGSAKAGLTAYMSGLRSRLAPKNILVITIKPGMVRTKMTENLQIPAILLVSPERVAKDIVRATECKKSVVYTPWWWRFIMLCIKLIPERLFISIFKNR